MAHANFGKSGRSETFVYVFLSHDADNELHWQTTGSTAQAAHYLPRAVCQTAGMSANTQSSYFMRRDKQHGIKPIHVAQLSSLSPGTESNST